MKILFWQWHSFMNRGIETAFQKLNVEYDILFYQQTDWEKNDGIVETLEQKLATLPGILKVTCLNIDEPEEDAEE